MTKNTKPHILITGGSGFVGQALLKELIKKDMPFRISSRHNSEPSMRAECVFISDINSETNWLKALENIDIIVHLAARVHMMHDTVVDSLAEFRKVNVDGTLHLARQAASAGVKRFIFISSIKVNGEQTNIGAPFAEEDIAAPQDGYGVSKFEAEQGLLLIAKQTGMEVVIIRPPLVYGPNVKANFASMMRVVKRSVPLPLGAIHNKRSFVYVENLVSFIILSIQHPLAANQTFLVSDGHDLSTTELLRECAYALGVKSRLLPVPQKMLEVIAGMLGKRDVVQRLCGDLQVDITKARKMLGWIPPISMSEGLKRTAVDLCKSGKK